MDGPSPFEFKPDDICGNDWKIWLRGFEIFAEANSITSAQEKLNWMLHYAGQKVQSVYYALPEKDVDDFGDQLDENLRDQVTSGCSSNLLRRKILERGHEQLESIVKMARILEAVSKQQQLFQNNVPDVQF